MPFNGRRWECQGEDVGIEQAEQCSKLTPTAPNLCFGQALVCSGGPVSCSALPGLVTSPPSSCIV